MSYQLPVLLYHRVVNDSCKIGKHKLYVYEKQFRKQMQWLKDEGYETMTFRNLELQKDLSKKIILTFDDGYVDNYTILFPILKEFGFTAVIYLVTGQTRNEWSLAEGEPAIDLMSSAQIREMDAYGIEFGGHTQHHIDLKRAAKAEQEKEISGCFEDIEKLTGKKPTSFAYPYGAYNEDTLALVKSVGFKYGITTLFGPDDWNNDLMRIKRIEVRPKNGLLAFKRKASGRYWNSSWMSFLFGTNASV
jgi:peptidoglycan/xylan/chitin deacetylase (PgdA/CDA1 family)